MSSLAPIRFEGFDNVFPTEILKRFGNYIGLLTPAQNLPEICLLHKRHVDLNFCTLVHRLTVVTKSDPLVTLLESPASWSSSRVDKIFLPVPDKSPSRNWTKSQFEAFLHICSDALTVVIGPPGSGKTKFLAECLAEIMISKHNQDLSENSVKPGFKIAVVAPTHTAIEKCLEDISSACQALGKWLNVARFSRDSKGKTKVHELLQQKCNTVVIKDFLEKQTYLIAGATSWQLAKTPFQWADLLAIDEASMLRTAELVLPLGTLNSSGRLVVVGDPLQLPPVVLNEFPLVPDSRLRVSVLDCLHQKGDKFFVQLEDTFRLNQELCLQASWLYNRFNYMLRSKQNSHLKYETKTRKQPFILPVLNDCVPSLVVIQVPNMDTESNDQYSIEQASVQAVVQDLKQCQAITPNELKSELKVCVITPHRKQKQFVATQLSSQDSSSQVSAVDTVERMQGQQCDVVIICMVILDPLVVANEATFLFNMQRLNVAFTRASSCCILIASSAVLYPLPRLLESENSAIGYSLLRNFMSQATIVPWDPQQLFDRHKYACALQEKQISEAQEKLKRESITTSRGLKNVLTPSEHVSCKPIAATSPQNNWCSAMNTKQASTSSDMQGSRQEASKRTMSMPSNSLLCSAMEIQDNVPEIQTKTSTQCPVRVTIMNDPDISEIYVNPEASVEEVKRQIETVRFSEKKSAHCVGIAANR